MKTMIDFLMLLGVCLVNSSCVNSESLKESSNFMLLEIFKIMFYAGIFLSGPLLFLYALTLKTKFSQYFSKRHRIVLLIVYCVLLVLLFFSTTNESVQRASAMAIPMVLFYGFILIRKSSIS